MISLGAKVHLRGCRHGEPGTVIRMERSRAVVLWGDLDYLARHTPNSLVEAETNIASTNDIGKSLFSKGE